MFRTAIFRQRGWDCLSEGKQCEDLVHQGIFILLAQARDIINAKPERVLFPIAQAAITANRLYVQSPGY